MNHFLEMYVQVNGPAKKSLTHQCWSEYNDNFSKINNLNFYCSTTQYQVHRKSPSQNEKMCAEEEIRQQKYTINTIQLKS